MGGHILSTMLCFIIDIIIFLYDLHDIVFIPDVKFHQRLSQTRRFLSQIYCTIL